MVAATHGRHWLQEGGLQNFAWSAGMDVVSAAVLQPDVIMGWADGSDLAKTFASFLEQWAQSFNGMHGQNAAGMCHSTGVELGLRAWRHNACTLGFRSGRNQH